MVGKYGTGQDPYCYPGTRTLRNRLEILDDTLLNQAEREVSESAAAHEIEYCPPPYNLAAPQKIHQQLFDEVYDWAGHVRNIDISKDDTRFCTVSRIEPEAAKLFEALAQRNWLTGLEREDLIKVVAELYGDLNMVHPFKEGNGRAQRILFEHIIVNAGYAISWWGVQPDEWKTANIDAAWCNYSPMEWVFDRCIGARIPD